MEEITRETKVKSSELAVVLGLSGRRIHQLAEDGVIIKAGRGQFCLADCVQRYVEYRAASTLDDEAQQIEAEKLKADADLKKAKATIARLEAAELEGNMHRSEDVAAMTEDLVYTIRGMILAMPGRLAVDVAEAETAAEAAELIRKEVFHVLRELANYRYDPQKYEERVRERRKWEAKNMPESDEE